MNASITCVHGTLVNGDESTVLITGQSGIGKSHLAFDLLASGYKLIADDTVILKKKTLIFSAFLLKKTEAI